jgi:CheY-like chemotaxis protein
VNAVDETNQVLLVDDDRLIRVMVGNMVRDAGCEPVTASNATEAIGSLATLQPLAALIDFYMPDSPGDECCKIIKSNEELAEVPIILMTAADADGEVQRAFLAGADDFLPKPVRAYQLATKLKAVREGLRRAKRERRDTPVKRVLLADQDGFFRALVGNLLERAGYDVVQAETGLSALRTMLRGRPKLDLCILNTTMPGFDGLELLRKIRASPELAKMPIFVTAESKDKANHLEELYSLGVLY